MEAKLANGEAIDVGEHTQLASTLVRIAARIGIDRVAWDVSLTLGEILRRGQDA